MCVATEKSRYEVIVCSNCGSEKVKERWVHKYKKNEPLKRSMEEKIDKIKPSTAFGISFSSCGDCSIISIPIQVVLFCEDCGFTVTKTIEQTK